jgi:hypothetical protein
MATDYFCTRKYNWYGLSSSNDTHNPPRSLIEGTSVPHVVGLFICAESGRIIHSQRREKIPFPCHAIGRRVSVLFLLIFSISLQSVSNVCATRVTEYFADKVPMHIREYSLVSYKPLLPVPDTPFSIQTQLNGLLG